MSTPTLTTFAILGSAVRNMGKRPTPKKFASPRRPRPEGKPMTSRELMPFVTKIISVHKRHQTYKTKRIQCVVRFLGITRTMHLDVPLDFTV